MLVNKQLEEERVEKEIYVAKQSTTNSWRKEDLN